jgi:hypothetical protein
MNCFIIWRLMYLILMSVRTDEIAGALTIGQDFGALREGNPHFFIKAIHGGFAFMNIFFTVTWLGEILKLMPMPKQAKETKGKCEEVSTTC